MIPLVEDDALESSEDNEGDEEGKDAGVQNKAKRIRIHGRHAAIMTFDGGLVHDVMEVREPRSVYKHWRGDDHRHHPGPDDHECGALEVLLCHHLGVPEGIIDSLESVHTDPNQTVDAGRAEGHIREDPQLAGRKTKVPASIL